MITAEHKAHHERLQKNLDELVADWQAHGTMVERRLPNTYTIADLMLWCLEQTKNEVPPS